nr:SUMF1/EgtB/PvdO family nonheme iron enzyme [Treponema sp. OMZ 787]
MLLIALIFTGCPNSAGGSGGGGTPPAPSADKTYTVGGVSFTMKKIAAVTNGTVGHTDNTGNNAPHTVSLTAYRIGETEVTQELWQAVMGTNPSFFDNTGNKTVGSNTYDTNITSGEVQEKRPVEYVNWYQCIAFCNKLSKLCNLDPCYTVTGVNFDTLNFSAIPTSDNSDWNNAVLDMSKNGFRLPTEAEWEWAAKGGKDYKWAGTNEKAQLVNYAWYNENSGNKTHQVKMKQPNAYGLYDMSGNVWEWCWDWYSSTTPTGGQDPAGGASGPDRVLRGGCWYYYADYCTVGGRYGSSPVIRDINLGFRLVCLP